MGVVGATLVVLAVMALVGWARVRGKAVTHANATGATAGTGALRVAATAAQLPPSASGNAAATPTTNNKRVVSVVVACMNRTPSLRTTLPSWTRIPSVGEIVVVDWSSSSPTTPQAQTGGDTSIESLTTREAASHPDITFRVVRVDGESKWMLARAYNLAASRATLPILLKLDCDYEIPDAAPLETLLGKMQTGFEDEAFFTGDWRSARDENEKHLNGLLAIRRADFRRVGGYDERIQTYGWDDTDLHERLTSEGMEHRTAPASEWGFRHVAHDDSARLGAASLTNEDSPPPPFVATQMNRLMLQALQKPWGPSLASSTYTETKHTTPTPNLETLQLRAAHVVPSLLSLVSDSQRNDALREARVRYLEKFAFHRNLLLRFDSEASLGPLVKAFHAHAERRRRDVQSSFVAASNSKTNDPGYDVRALVVQTPGGLCNRLRSLATGIALAHAQNRVPVMVWVLNEHCQASWTDLFELPNPATDFVLLREWPVEWPFSPLSEWRTWELHNYIEAERDAGLAANVPFHYNLRRRHVIPPETKHAYVRTPAGIVSNVNLRPDSNHVLKHTFKPVAWVRDEVERLTKQFDLRNARGVHMRTRSLEQDIAGVSAKSYPKSHQEKVGQFNAITGNITNFAREMERVWRDVDPHARFFVAADQIEKRVELRDMLVQRGAPRDAVVFYDGACDDRSATCMRTALVDLLCLGRTTTLIGSGWSSYTEVACRLGRGALGNRRAYVLGMGWVSACNS